MWFISCEKHAASHARLTLWFSCAESWRLCTKQKSMPRYKFPIRLVSRLLFLEDDLVALKAFNKAFNPGICSYWGLDIQHVLHCSHSLHFSPVTGGTCCERWNTMLLELYPRVDYVSPHSLKDGWMWFHPPQHLEFHPSCFVKCCECVCVFTIYCTRAAMKRQMQKLLKMNSKKWRRKGKTMQSLISKITNQAINISSRRIN